MSAPTATPWMHRHLPFGPLTDFFRQHEKVKPEVFIVLVGRHADPGFAPAAEQLKDPDQQVRLLGLIHLNAATPSVGIPFVAALLDDPDIAVLGLSVKLLENWSAEKFGVKLADTAQVENKTTTTKPPQPH